MRIGVEFTPSWECVLYTRVVRLGRQTGCPFPYFNRYRKGNLASGYVQAKRLSGPYKTKCQTSLVEMRNCVITLINRPVYLDRIFEE